MSPLGTIKKEQRRQPSQGVKNAESQQPSQAVLTFLIRQDFFLLEFSGKKSSLPLVALLWHIIQHFWLPAANKLVASTANVCKFFFFFFLHVDARCPFVDKALFSIDLVVFAFCQRPVGSVFAVLPLYLFLSSAGLRVCSLTRTALSVALEEVLQSGGVFKRSFSSVLHQLLWISCKIYHQLAASHKITCWDFDIHGKCCCCCCFFFLLASFFKKSHFWRKCQALSISCQNKNFFSLASIWYTSETESRSPETIVWLSASHWQNWAHGLSLVNCQHLKTLRSLSWNLKLIKIKIHQLRQWGCLKWSRNKHLKKSYV